MMPIRSERSSQMLRMNVIKTFIDNAYTASPIQIHILEMVDVEYL